LVVSGFRAGVHAVIDACLRTAENLERFRDDLTAIDDFLGPLVEGNLISGSEARLGLASPKLSKFRAIGHNAEMLCRERVFRYLPPGYTPIYQVTVLYSVLHGDETQRFEQLVRELDALSPLSRERLIARTEEIKRAKKGASILPSTSDAGDCRAASDVDPIVNHGAHCNLALITPDAQRDLWRLSEDYVAEPEFLRFARELLAEEAVAVSIARLRGERQMTKPKKDFSFGDHAPMFNSHIRSSIPGYTALVHDCVNLSLRYVQPGTTVIDVGCSTGHLLAMIRKENQAARPDVDYVGIDCEPNFSPHWDRRRPKNLRYEVSDARTHPFMNVSLACSLFTVQFIPPGDKLPLLGRIHDGLVEGGALIIAEKSLAETARLQDALTFPYYDYKREQGFSPEHILDKERSLRGQMTLWTETELRAALGQVGFREINPIWRRLMFVGLLALK
jgi:tRNA (cmo5U34)-methyltransferase